MAYIHSEDMAIVFVGPFESAEAAQTHMDRYFPSYRKTEGGYNDFVIEGYPESPYVGYKPTIVSPEDDILDWEAERENNDD